MEKKYPKPPKRYNLSGCYIFQKQEDGSRLPTCIEDCDQQTINDYLWKCYQRKDGERFCRSVTERMYDVMLDIFKRAPIEWPSKGAQDEMIKAYETKRRVALAESEHFGAYEIAMRSCELLRFIGETLGIEHPENED